MPNDNHDNELEEFEAFIEPDFNAIKFANNLLLATNNKDETELDLDTSMKRLKFDLTESQRRMSTIASSNQDMWMYCLSQIEKSKYVLDNQVNPSMTSVNNSFDRLKREILEPYDEAVKINNALKKLHTTLDLIRGANFIMTIMQQLDEVEKLSNTEDNGKSLIRLAKLHLHISQIYEKEVKGSNHEGASLLSIKLIRDFEGIHITKKRDFERDRANLIANETSHASSFNSTNITLQNNLIALFTIDEKEFYEVLQRTTINKQTQSSLNQLTRSLQSPRNFIVIIREVKASSNEFLEKLIHLLTNCTTSSLERNPDNSKNLLEKFQKYLGTESLAQYYWKGLSYRFKKNIVAIMARGGPIAKNLKVYYEGIKNTIVETFEEPEPFLEAVEMIQGVK